MELNTTCLNSKFVKLKHIDFHDFPAVDFNDQNNSAFTAFYRFDFEVILNDGRKVFMAAGQGKGSGNFVVIVDAQKFLKLWQNTSDLYWAEQDRLHEQHRPHGLLETIRGLMGRSSNYDAEYFENKRVALTDFNTNNKFSYYPRDIAHGNIESWRSFRKFNEAEDGFSTEAWIPDAWSPVPLALVYFGLKQNIPCVSFQNGVTRTIWLLANEAKEFPIGCGNEIDDAKLLLAYAGADGVDDIFNIPFHIFK